PHRRRFESARVVFPALASERSKRGVQRFNCRQRSSFKMLLRTLSLIEALGYNRASLMAITIGQQLGTYEITALLGKGGMGEVYRARDTTLKGEVAIKILPADLAGDPDRLLRFEREAHLLASLNHPNIGAIYDLGESNGTKFFVLELVPGDTLADLIVRGPVP